MALNILLEKTRRGAGAGPPGFTLIEAIIVVAIGGIVAMMSIPVYQQYIAKTQIADVVAQLHRSRLLIEEYVLTSGTFPNDTTTLAIQHDASFVSRYIVGVTLTPSAPDATSGRITATLGGRAASRHISSERISYTRSPDGSWICEAPGTGTTTLTQLYLPTDCR